jgi:hypothetical protein
MNFSILAFSEDPDLALGTNLLQPFRKIFFGACPQSTSLTVLVLAEDPEGVLEMGLDVRFPALLSHDQHKVTEVQGSRPVICTTGTEHCSPLYSEQKRNKTKQCKSVY